MPKTAQNLGGMDSEKRRLYSFYYMLIGTSKIHSIPLIEDFRRCDISYNKRKYWDSYQLS